MSITVTKKLYPIKTLRHNSYHSTYSYQERKCLDRRKFEDGHVRFAVLQVIAWYKDQFSLNDTPLLASVNETLKSVTSKYFSSFTQTYSGKVKLYIYPHTAT